jgi:two-component system sensor histidine kinase MprB
MSLRVRLAIALGLLATVSVVAVATTNYLQTSNRLHDEVDAQLRADARPLQRSTDPKGFITRGLCIELARGMPGIVSGYAARVAAQLGTSLQCLDANGHVAGWTGKVNLPIRHGDPLHPAAPRLTTETFRGEDYRVNTFPASDGSTMRISRSLADTEKVLRSIRNRSMLIGLAVLALAALGGWLIARRTARPVARLTAAAEEVAATGRLEHPVPTGGNDEVGRLARSFTSMLAALDASHAQQQQLVQDASHELRTPLTSLRTNLDTLRRHEDLPPDVRERVLADLDSELTELRTLTNELVELTIESHNAEVEAPVALDQLVRRVAARTSRRSGREVAIDSVPTVVLARPDALRRALANLLDNATKFSPDGTSIEITVRPGLVQVRDHGPGIAADDLPHVFDRFYRAIDARGLPGSGLGLSITRAVVESCGGTVRADNDPGGGARFTVELPRVDGANAAGEPTPADHTAGDPGAHDAAKGASGAPVGRRSVDHRL